MKLKGIIFDFDGTVANTLPVVFNAFRRTFLDFTGREYSDEEIPPLFGPNEEGVCRNVVGERYREAYEMYLREYDKHHDVLCGGHFPGMIEALTELRQRGLKLGIVTGKGKESADISMRHLGLAPYFDAVETGSIEGSTKYELIRKLLEDWNVRPEEAAYVGDAGSDMEVAKQVGVIPLGAAWADTANYEELRASEPAAIFRSVGELVAWVKDNSRGSEDTLVGGKNQK